MLFLLRKNGNFAEKVFATKYVFDMIKASDNEGRIVLGQDLDYENRLKDNEESASVETMDAAEEMVDEYDELEWENDEDEGKRLPPYMLEIAIKSYAEDLTLVYENAKDMSTKYRGYNIVLERMIEENRGYLSFDGLKMHIYYEVLKKSKLSMDTHRNLEDYLHTLNWVLHNGSPEVFNPDRHWWRRKINGVFPGVVILHRLWFLLDNEVEVLGHKLYLLNELPKDIIPATGYPFIRRKREKKKETKESAAIDEVAGVAPPHFAMGADRKHWADVYHRAVGRQYISGREVSCADFVYIMCGPENALSSAPKSKVRWMCFTRSLAYIVKNYMSANWDVARYWFYDKNGKPLPASFEKTNVPKSEKNLREIKEIFE